LYGVVFPKIECAPAFTSATWDIAAMGQRAADALIRRVEQQQTASLRTIGDPLWPLTRKPLRQTIYAKAISWRPWCVRFVMWQRQTKPICPS
ncbi:MAG: hypothetical protein WB037_22660, partial [Pseudolabrys sp.]